MNKKKSSIQGIQREKNPSREESSTRRNPAWEEMAII